ncbi:MAG: AMP-binding protein, partial [Aureliella sp.]
SGGPAWPAWCVGASMNMTQSLLDRHLEAGRGAHEAIVWQGEDGAVRRLSYEELARQVNRLASGLQALGLRTGDAVGLYLPMAPEVAIAYLALARLGCVVLPLFSGFGAAAISSRLNDAQAVALITADRGLRRGREIDMRSIADEAVTELRHQLHAPLHNEETVALRLRAMWTLHVVTALGESELMSLLDDEQAYMRAWAIQLLCEDFQISDAAAEKFMTLATSDPSPVVRIYLAAASQRVLPETRWRMLERLVEHSADNQDHNIPKMLWFACEPLVVLDEVRALDLAKRSRISLVTRFIARRLGDAERFDTVLKHAVAATADQQLDLLLGLRDATEGRYDMKPPLSWPEIYPQLDAVGGQVAKVALQLAQQFGDTLAAEEMLATLRDRTADIEQRRHALQTLAGRKRVELKSELIGLLDEAELRREAIRAVSSFDEPQIAGELLNRYPNWNADEKLEVIHALSSRSGYGNQLTMAIKNGTIPKQDIPAHVSRILRRVVGNRFIDVWGPLDALSADKEAMFVKYRELLSEHALKSADLANGHAIFNRSCAACHKLHGEGGSIGPDITGANRGNLEYLLSNIVTPSAIVQDAYRMHVILTADGRIYSGILIDETDRYTRLRVADREEPVTIARADIDSREISAVSMMPDGVLSTFTDSEVIDLIGYLQATPSAPVVGSSQR